MVWNFKPCDPENDGCQRQSISGSGYFSGLKMYSDLETGDPHLHLHAGASVTAFTMSI
jgi:hypothetical protein